MIGQTLSHYRIIDRIGAGGMGEVYRATDTPLNRDVANKVLPPDVAQDPERLGRFRREAHLLASLNHPNIAAIPSGKVKVLDFGLAKAWAGDTADRSSSSGALSQSPTFAHMGTMAGVILGTAAYMSPEQARGKPVDKRADVWSFGVLLWEMLTGHALFAGDTVTARGRA